jgi:hypothetical protein
VFDSVKSRIGRGRGGAEGEAFPQVRVVTRSSPLMMGCVASNAPLGMLRPYRARRQGKGGGPRRWQERRRWAGCAGGRGAVGEGGRRGRAPRPDAIAAERAGRAFDKAEGLC